MTAGSPGRRIYPTEVLLPVEASHLPSSFLALCHQLRTVSASRLSPSQYRLEDEELRAEIERAVQVWLAM